MPVLVDGNNLLHRLPRGQRSRTEVRRRVLDLVRREGVRVTVVFDGPPPLGTPAREALGSVTVEYAGARSADAVILARLTPGRARQATVVTDDRELADSARRAGATVRTVASWLDKLAAPRREKPGPLAADDVAAWEEYFAGGGEDDTSA